MKREYEMPMTVLVDTMEDQSRALFSDLPSPVFIIDAKGVIQNKFPWPEAEQIKLAVKKMLAAGEPEKNNVSEHTRGSQGDAKMSKH